MIQKAALILTVIVFGFIMGTAAFANPGKPNFSPALYADGEVWGTKGTTDLPPPNEHNMQSFDKLFVIINGADGQFPVGEAAPGNPYYNGGRWFTHTVMWIDSEEVQILRSYEEILSHEAAGSLIATPGSFTGGPPAYFQCPLLPIK